MDTVILTVSYVGADGIRVFVEYEDTPEMIGRIKAYISLDHNVKFEDLIICLGE